MVTTTFRVVVDANALFPNTLRDTLLRAAAAGLYQLYWSAQILEEARRNLVLKGHMNEAQSRRLVDFMQRAFPEALISGHEALIPSMRNDEGDRHVVAAAVLAGAQVIITSNLKHFRREDLPPTVVAKSPDDFLLDLLDLAPEQMLQLLRDQAAALKNPPISLERMLGGLAKSAPRFVELVRSALKVRTDAEVEALVESFEGLFGRLRRGETHGTFWADFDAVLTAMLQEFPEMQRRFHAAGRAQAHEWVRAVVTLARDTVGHPAHEEALQLLRRAGFDLVAMTLDDIEAMSDEELHAMLDRTAAEKH